MHARMGHSAHRESPGASLRWFFQRPVSEPGWRSRVFRSRVAAECQGRRLPGSVQREQGNPGRRSDETSKHQTTSKHQETSGNIRKHHETSPGNITRKHQHGHGNIRQAHSRTRKHHTETSDRHILRDFLAADGVRTVLEKKARPGKRTGLRMNCRVGRRQSRGK